MFTEPGRPMRAECKQKPLAGCRVVREEAREVQMGYCCCVGFADCAGIGSGTGPSGREYSHGGTQRVKR